MSLCGFVEMMIMVPIMTKEMNIILYHGEFYFETF